MITSRCAAVLVAAFALLTSSTLNAQTYLEKGFFCTTLPVTWSEPGTPPPLVAGQLTVHLPQLTSLMPPPNVEEVYFMAVVHKWNPATGQFAPYQHLPSTADYRYTGTWYHGMANSNGQVAFNFDPSWPEYWRQNGRPVGYPVIGLPSGYYKVAEYYKWQYGATGSTWATLVLPGVLKSGAPVGTKGGYCKIGTP